MIRFTCKQCGAKISRPDDMAGAAVFCSCGQQNRVPWESTEPEPLEPEPPLPILVEEEEEQPRPHRRAEPSARGWRPFRKTEKPIRDPNCCLNHPDRPKTTICADCHEPFCATCVVTVRDQSLCGPCKNFRVRSLQRPQTPSALAIVSAVTGLISCPFVFCVSITAVAGQQDGSGSGGAVLSAALSVLPLAAFILGLFGLRQTELNSRSSGRVFAVTGMTTAAAGFLWCLTLAWVASMRNLGN